MLVSGETNCSSTGIPKEWFPPLNPNHGLLDYNTNTPPGWGACLQYSRATCCEKNQTDVVFRLLIGMEKSNFSKFCLLMTEKVLCAISCNPDVGLGKIPPIMCLNTCIEWYAACKDDFFSPSTVGIQKIPSPCSDSAVVCSRLGDVYHSGNEMCEAMSLKWGTEDACLSGEVDLERRGRIIFSSSDKSTHGTSKTDYGLIELFLRDMRIFGSMIQKFANYYMHTIDRFVGKYHIRLKWVGIFTFVSLVIPIVLRSLKQKRRPNNPNNNNFARGQNEFYRSDMMRPRSPPQQGGGMLPQQQFPGPHHHNQQQHYQHNRFDDNRGMGPRGVGMDHRGNFTRGSQGRFDGPNDLKRAGPPTSLTTTTATANSAPNTTNNNNPNVAEGPNKRFRSANRLGGEDDQQPSPQHLQRK